MDCVWCFGGVVCLYGVLVVVVFEWVYVVVIGIGGVGLWVVEVFVCNVIGMLMLIDFDNVVESNMNW